MENIDNKANKANKANKDNKDNEDNKENTDIKEGNKENIEISDNTDNTVIKDSKVNDPPSELIKRILIPQLFTKSSIKYKCLLPTKKINLTKTNNDENEQKSANELLFNQNQTNKQNQVNDKWNWPTTSVNYVKFEDINYINNKKREKIRNNLINKVSDIPIEKAGENDKKNNEIININDNDNVNTLENDKGKDLNNKLLINSPILYEISEMDLNMLINKINIKPTIFTKNSNTKSRHYQNTIKLESIPQFNKTLHNNNYIFTIKIQKAWSKYKLTSLMLPLNKIILPTSFISKTFIPDHNLKTIRLIEDNFKKREYRNLYNNPADIVKIYKIEEKEPYGPCLAIKNNSSMIGKMLKNRIANKKDYLKNLSKRNNGLLLVPKLSIKTNMMDYDQFNCSAKKIQRKFFRYLHNKKKLMFFRYFKKKVRLLIKTLIHN